MALSKVAASSTDPVAVTVIYFFFVLTNLTEREYVNAGTRTNGIKRTLVMHNRTLKILKKKKSKCEKHLSPSREHICQRTDTHRAVQWKLSV